MKAIKFFIERKVTISMIYVLAILLGLIAWSKLPKEFMPSIEFPQLTVITSYQHASSQEVENLVTKVIEEGCGTVRGVQGIYSISREGVSFVTIEFGWGTDMDFASLNLREKIDLIKGKLPRECKDPRIERFNPFAMPVLIISMSGNRPSEDLLEIAKRPVREMLEKVTGVAQISLMGGREREIRVELEKDRLAAHRISVLDVVDKVKHSNITFPTGSIKDKVYEYTVRVVGLFKNIADIRKVAFVVKHKDKAPSSDKGREMELSQDGSEKRLVSLGMLGNVVDDYKEIASYSRYDKKDNISLSVLKQGDAYIVDVAEACKKKLEKIKDRIPKDVNIEVVYDQSKYIKESIKSLLTNGFEGAILAFLVILFFLANMRDALVVSVSIPISIFIALFLLHISGVTINTISMAGLILGIGQLVDASIVVQENIARYRKTMGVVQAAITGAKEVIGSVVGSILTTIVVFLPLIFVPGIIGQVFNDLSLAIIYSLSASLLVAFTLVPMLASLTADSGDGKSKIKLLEKWRNFSNRLGTKIGGYYKKIMFYCFKSPKKVIAGFVALSLMMGAVLFLVIPKELFPKVSQTQFMIKIDMPVGTRLNVTNRVVDIVEKMLFNNEKIKHCSVTIGSIAKEGVQLLGSHQAQIVVEIYEKDKRELDTIIQDIRSNLTSPKYEEKDILAALEGAKLTFSRQGGAFSALATQRGGVPGYSKPIVIEIKGHDLDEMSVVANNLKSKLSKASGIKDVTTSVSMAGPEVVIDVDKDMLASYNLIVSKLAKTVLTAVKGRVASKFREQGKEIDIHVGLREEDTEDVGKLGSLLIESPLGMDIPLDAVAKIEKGHGPSEILRVDQERTIIVSAEREGISLEDAKLEVNSFIAEESVDKPHLAINLAGESAQVKESSRSLVIILILSIMFVYMVMASEFESLWQPFLILFTIPMSLIGIVPGLLASGYKLSVMSGMGIVLVGGLVVNNGIVLIDFINQRMGDKKPLEDIIFDASMTRIRPIFMTAFTAVLGLFPLMLNLDGRSDMQSPMATVVVWGLCAATFLTLIVLPTLYYLVKRKKKGGQTLF